MASHTEIARKQALSEQIAASRARVGQKVADVRRAMDVPARARTALRRNPGAVLAGSTALGLLASLWLRRRRRKRRAEAALIDSLENPLLKRKSMLANGAGFLGGMLKTAAKAYLLEAVAKAVIPRAGGAKPPRW